MTTAICKYPTYLQGTIAIRRIHGETMGLGYWAAIDYLNRKKNEDNQMESSRNEQEQTKPETNPS